MKVSWVWPALPCAAIKAYVRTTWSTHSSFSWTHLKAWSPPRQEQRRWSYFHPAEFLWPNSISRTGVGEGGLLPSSQIQEVFHQPQSHYIATVSVGRYYFVKENLCLVRKYKTCVGDFLPTVGACSNIRYHRRYFVLLLRLEGSH